MLRGFRCSRALLSLVVLSAVVALLAGCASSPPEPPRSHGATAPHTGQGAMAVTGVQRLDATRLRITVQVPAPKHACVSDLGGRVTDVESATVRVQVTYTGPADDTRCTGVTTASAVVTVPDLRGKELVVDTDQPWVPVPGSTTFRQCTGSFGCAAPPANHCDDAWIDLVAHSGEMQPERYYEQRGCTQSWLVLDVDATATGCQGVDGTRPTGCTSRSVRWFAEFRPPAGWVVVASGRAAGCADVHRTVPAFPRALCERLPAR